MEVGRVFRLMRLFAQAPAISSVRLAGAQYEGDGSSALLQFNKFFWILLQDLIKEQNNTQTWQWPYSGYSERLQVTSPQVPAHLPLI